MPRVAAALALILLASFVLAPLSTAGAPEVGGPINAAATARPSCIGCRGVGVEGGAFDETVLCDRCLVKIAMDSGTLTVVEGGQTVQLPPGAYTIIDYYGVYAYQGTFLELHGEGKLVSGGL